MKMSLENLWGHRHSHIIIILLSVIAGAAIAGVVIYYPRVEPAVTLPVTAQPLTTLEEGFVAVAERARPAVVNISAERVEKRRLPTLPDFEEFFRQFPWPFGEPEGREGEEKKPYRYEFRWPFGQPEQPEGKEKEPEFKEFRGRSLGSGWIYSADGYIVTNAHVVEGASDIKVQFYDVENDDRKYPANLIATDPKTELAVIKVEVNRKLPALSLGSSKDAKVGEWVIAVGSPLGLQQTVTAGIISAKGRTLPGTSKYIRLGDIIQTDAAINFGNSGGPLVNLQGEVVGINVAIAAQAPRPMAGNIGIGFSIASDTAKEVVPQLIKQKKVTRGWLGISIQELTPNLKDAYGAEYGVLVSNIQSDSPASKSDLQAEDVIVAVDGEKVENTWDLQKAVMSKQPGTLVTLDVIRNKQPKQVKVKLGEMPGKYAGLEQPQEETEPATKQALGLTVGELTSQIAEDLHLPADTEGVVAMEVDAGGPAAESVEKGDIITQINRQPVKSLDDYQQAIEQAKESGKDYVILHLLRMVDGEVHRLIVDIAVNW